VNLLWALGIFAFLVSGCSTIGSTIETIPTPADVISSPLGTESVKIGMTKGQVKDIWGEPDSVTNEEIKETKRIREVWIYRARARQIPIDAGYLSKTHRLYFDGDNLTGITE